MKGKGLFLGVLLLVLLTGSAWSADDKGAGPPEGKAAGEAAKATEIKPPEFNSGDTAWMLMSTGLVMLMVPGLALFYGGMVRRKNILGTMMHSMVALGLIGLQWLLFGYSLAFGDSINGLIGWKSDYLGLWNVKPSDLFPGTGIPVYVHCMYQGMFAIITPALISGALAERIKFGPYCLFIFLWAVLVYDPLAHWVWAVKGDPTAADPFNTVSVGWLGDMGALDFAGGTVVHISAGFSALAAFLILRKRIGYPEHAFHPASMVLTLTGAGLLWFGWFGFNGGSALGSSALSGMALTATQVAAAAAAMSWLMAEWLHKGKPTALGFASGLVAGLVAVTPASGFVGPLSAVVIGLAAGVVCYTAVCLKASFKYDDSLDAFGVHGVGGFLGAVLTGVFASGVLFINAAGKPEGFELGKLLTGGRTGQIGIQALAACVAAFYAFGLSLVLVWLIHALFGFTVDEKEENVGLDRGEHGETGFDLSLALESAPTGGASYEPRPANYPPNGKRFSIVLEGVTPGELKQVWSDLCQAGPMPPSREFLEVYPHLTTMQGTRFHFRGGDPPRLSHGLAKVIETRLPGKRITAKVEN